MNVVEIFEKMDDFHQLAEEYREDLNRALNKLIEGAFLQYQYEDGWCVVWGGDYNAHVTARELDSLLKMDQKAALEWLTARSI